MSPRTLFVLAMIVPWIATAQVVQVQGHLQTTLKMRLDQSLALTPGTSLLAISFVQPETFRSATYSQEITAFEIETRPPSTRSERTPSRHGSIITTHFWENPPHEVQASVNINARTSVLLDSLKIRQIPFPVSVMPDSLRTFLRESEAVQSNAAAISELAADLRSGLEFQYQVVEAVQRWIVANLHYILQPTRYDALWTLENKKGNCQNFSHLAAALLRNLGIPVRIVNGITLKWPYQVAIDKDIYQFEMAQGRHSWIEIYFSGLGWFPFDPQQSEFFVSNRYLRFEIGIDNEESINDGLVRWSGATQPEPPAVGEQIFAEVVKDDLLLEGTIVDMTVPRMVLTPVIAGEVAYRVEEEVEEPAPQKIAETVETPPLDYPKLDYSEDFLFGNLDFPEGVNFAFARSVSDKGELSRNFLVETAEYVTSNREFAQAFRLDRPVKLEQIDLALHKFGGSGSLWVELCEDRQGKPSDETIPSQRVPLQYFQRGTGYRWVAFDFRSQGLILSPGLYWIRLKYSGGPIVNWFYSYGKNVGRADGTRSRDRQNPDWNKVHMFEFNFRVAGKTTEWPIK